ncbi:hypothetical protein [Leifsonia sp. EB34]|uniref:hypothetical protein n=1 Tax=Leifsonia sp. EB34 TaxID=3156303 RepID=UPI003518DD97
MLRRVGALALLPAFILLLAGCSALPSSHLVGAVHSDTVAPHSITAVDAGAGATAAPSAGSGPSSAPVAAAPQPVAVPAGVVLPDASRTPGATNPAVTQANVHQTICVSGYTATIRPPASYTTGLKRQQLASGYAYQGDTNTRDYEEDHLISLEIGGSPDSPQNLWPEPYAGSDGARTKDRIENKLHDLVGSGQLTLAAAQHAIAVNWWSAYQTYVG